MGKGFENYMSKKWFHPTNVENQKRKYLAEQKSAADKKRQQDLRDQYEREQEDFSNKQLMGDEKARLGLAFMYNAPGSLKDQDKDKKNDQDDNDKYEFQNQKVSSSAANGGVRNMRCLKCKRWGHANTDKSCPLYGKSRLDVEADEIPQMEPDLVLENIKVEKVEVLNESQNTNKNSEVSDKDEITLDMLRALPKKEKKVLLKRLLRLDKKKRKHSSKH